MKEDFRSGFLSVIGRPNVGKSTLLNRLVGNKISIVSPVPQTTRYQIKVILNLNNAQIVFVDTPGIHSFKERLAGHLNTIAKRSLEGCDLILYLVDTSRKIGREEEKIVDLLLSQKTKVIMALNKLDRGGKFINDYVGLWEEKNKKKEQLLYYLPLSAKTGKNIDKLKELIVENLPCQQPFYRPGAVTDFPLRFRIADIIREKLFLNLKKELPHSLAVGIEEIEDKDKLVYIKAVIYLSRASQKKIVIGKAGEMLKSVGSEARQEAEKIYKKKVYLDLWVKAISDWQKSERILKELGYWWA